MSKAADIQRAAREVVERYDQLMALPGEADIGDELSDNYTAMAELLRRLYTRAVKTQPLCNAPPQLKQATSRIWQCMRILREFTEPEIEAAATVSQASARKFIIALREAGYIRVEHATTFEVGDHSRYALVENTGPHAPRLRANGKAIYDCNLKKEVPRVRA